MIYQKKTLLPLIASYLPENPIIVEGGAFHGHDTIRMAEQWPHGIIHAFEPIPAIYEQLCEQTKGYSTIHCHQLALSGKGGTALFYCSEKPDKPGIPTQAGSLHKPQRRLHHSPIIFPATTTVETTTLTAWTERNDIDHIDLLWLDTQGHEYTILSSLSKKLLTTIRAIYCEVHFIQSYENHPLYDEVKGWLEKNGFVIIAQDFSEKPQHFFGNVLAVRPTI